MRSPATRSRRRSCTPISMPSMRRSSSCWTLRCGTDPSRSAAVSCSPHRTKRGASASAAACPGGGPASSARLVFVGGHFDRYQQFGDEVMSVFHDFTPRVERVSIDEAFLDVAGAVHLFGAPTEIATAIRRRVRDEIGLPLSVGVARTKHLAKVASQVAKPDGLVAVAPSDESAFLDPLPVGLIWGVGPTTERRLREAGHLHHRATGPGRQPDPGSLLGQAAGAKLAALSANVDERAVNPPPRSKSMGAQAALGRRDVTPELVRETLGYLADRVPADCGRRTWPVGTVTVRVRFRRMRSVTRSVTLAVAISTTLTLTEVAERLARSAIADNGQSAQSLSSPSRSPTSARSIPCSSSSPSIRRRGRRRRRQRARGRDERPTIGSVVEASRWGVDRSIDAIREKFGRTAVGYASVALSPEDRVPEQFRQLAERDPSSNGGRRPGISWLLTA